MSIGIYDTMLVAMPKQQLKIADVSARPSMPAPTTCPAVSAFTPAVSSMIMPVQLPFRMLCVPD